MLGDHGRACDSALRRVDRVLALCAEGDSRPFVDVRSGCLGANNSEGDTRSFGVPLPSPDGFSIAGVFNFRDFKTSDVKLIGSNSAAYELMDDGGFNQWVYLFDSDEFHAAASTNDIDFILDCQFRRKILTSVNGVHHLGIIVMKLKVNYVFMSSSSLFVRDRSYELVFRT